MATNTKPTTAIIDGKPLKPIGDEVESNHNTLDPAQPMPLAQITDDRYKKPDYNPQRRPGSFANVQSDTTMNAKDSEALVDEKGDRPSAAEVEAGENDPRAGTETQEEMDAETPGK